MGVRGLWIVAAMAVVLPGAMVKASGGGDAEAGKKVFLRCQACHRVDASGKSGIGPNLHGVIGRTSGTLPGFKYSPAMVAAKRVWTEKALDAYLAGPAKSLPGNRMALAGIRDPEDRKNVIAYIKSASR